MSSRAPAAKAEVLKSLEKEEIGRMTYEIFVNEVRENLLATYKKYESGDDLGSPFAETANPDRRFLDVLAVIRCLVRRRVATGEQGFFATQSEGGEMPIQTWAAYAEALHQAMATNNLVAHDDQHAHLEIALFAQRLSLELSVVYERELELAGDFVKFLVGLADRTVHEADFTEQPLQQPEADFTEQPLQQPEADFTEKPLQQPEIDDEDEVPVTSEPEKEDVAEEEFHVDEDGDVVMETGEMSSASRGPKRRRSPGLSYNKESSRTKMVKKLYNLRSTRAREERLTRLKAVEDSKRKAGEAESSSKGSRKRSKR